jgi:SAM-dependent methyltransferase
MTRGTIERALARSEDRPVLRDFLTLLACPAQRQAASTCGGRLDLRGNGLVCVACGATYEIQDGTPILLPDQASRPHVSATWGQQREYFDSGLDAEYEIERPTAGGPFYNFLVRTKFQRAFCSDLPGTLASGPILDACCGSGILSEYLAKKFNSVIVGFDFSIGAVGRARERARRRGYDFLGVVGDAGAPPFQPGAFSVVAVHDALHHLDDPMDAVKRLAVLTSRAFVVMEPCESWLTRIAVAVGFSTDVEEAGNPVRRLGTAALADAVRCVGFSLIDVDRYVMYYPHRPGRLFRLFDHQPLLSFGRLAVKLGQLLGPVGGNKLQLVAQR